MTVGENAHVAIAGVVDNESLRKASREVSEIVGRASADQERVGKDLRSGVLRWNAVRGDVILEQGLGNCVGIIWQSIVVGHKERVVLAIVKRDAMLGSKGLKVAAAIRMTMGLSKAVHSLLDGLNLRCSKGRKGKD